MEPSDVRDCLKGMVKLRREATPKEFFTGLAELPTDDRADIAALVYAITATVLASMDADDALKTQTAGNC